MKRVIAVAISLTLVCGAAFADQLEGVGATIWGKQQAILNAFTTYCVSSGTESDECALFYAGKSRENIVNVVKASGAGTCCWTLDHDAGAIVTDQILGTSSIGGSSSCFRFEGDIDQVHERPVFDQKFGGVQVGLSRGDRNGGGAVTGVCETATTAGGLNLYPPCRVNADCTDYTAADTCDTTPEHDQTQNTGAYLRCSMEAASSTVSVSVQYIPTVPSR